jgi:P-type Cu+ transporter
MPNKIPISHCPENVMQRLDKMSQILHAEPPTLQDPVLRLTYEPSPPTFTIRDVISAIMSSNSPPFRVTIHKPPTIEDRARIIQAKEKRSLLYRLGFAVITAIPTFIIGVVFMSLVSSENPIRNYLMEPMWMGNASRIQWMLFFFATPVMFNSAGSFHRRSWKEIHALWRRGSRTPVWKRFLRFGSMNLLVCTLPPHLFATLIVFDTDIIRSVGSLFLLHRLAGPCSLGLIISRRSRGYIHIFRLRHLPYDVPSHRYVA